MKYVNKSGENVEIYYGILRFTKLHFVHRDGIHIFIESDNFETEELYKDSLSDSKGIGIHEYSPLAEKYEKVVSEIINKFPGRRIYLRGTKGQLYILIENPVFVPIIKRLDNEKYVKIKEGVLSVLEISELASLASEETL